MTSIADDDRATSTVVGRPERVGDPQTVIEEKNPWAECAPPASTLTEGPTVSESASVLAAAGPEDGEDTVMFDRDQQDKLMRLRAQQDQILKERFGDSVTVMFTDLVGSTGYYEKHGDLMGRQKMLTHHALLFPIIRTHNGSVIKTIGDGLMTCFESANAALLAAEQMQGALAKFNESCADADDEIHIRIGVNTGPAIAEDGDLHGDAVNVAARIQARAAADETLVSESVVTLAPEGRFESIGPIVFRGKAEPVPVHRALRDGTRSPQTTDPRHIRSVKNGRYELGEAIGQGPMAVVYDAMDTSLSTRVTVKILHDFVARDPETRSMFVQRVQRMAALQHSGILRILDVSDPDEHPYYVAEQVDGGRSLAKWVAVNGRPITTMSSGIVSDVATIVWVAHAHGLIHANIKPENVIVDSQGRLHLTDFGMGDIYRRSVLGSGIPVAPPAYMAPEQLTGGEIDEQTDIYGLGALFYFLLAGQAPYDTSASLRAVREVASGMFTSIDHVRTDLPNDIVTIVNRCMTARPTRRYSSVAVLHRDIERAGSRAQTSVEGAPTTLIISEAEITADDSTNRTMAAAVDPAIVARAAARAAQFAEIRRASEAQLARQESRKDRSHSASEMPDTNASGPFMPVSRTLIVRRSRRSRRVISVVAALLLAIVLLGAWWLTSAAAATHPPATDVVDAAGFHVSPMGGKSSEENEAPEPESRTR